MKIDPSSGTLAGARAGLFSDVCGTSRSRMESSWASSYTAPVPGRRYVQQRSFARGLLLLAFGALVIGVLMLAKTGFFAASGWFLAAGGNALAGAAWWPLGKSGSSPA